MGKWLWFGTAAVIVGSVYWHCYSAKTSVEMLTQVSREFLHSHHRTQTTNPAVEIDVCDTIEPLVVEGSALPQVPPMEPAADEVTARVVLKVGMQQPPRPDAEPGKVLRMPYADEEGDSSAAVLDIMEALLSQLNIRENADDSNPAEESELKDVAAPMQQPQPERDPAMDYHHQHQHCPYSGAYCNPYRR